MTILKVENLSLSFNGKPILDDLSVDFWEGHILAVVGPNGAGKSTLACTIIRLAGYRDFTGDVLYKNKSIKDLTIDQRAQKDIIDMKYLIDNLFPFYKKVVEGSVVAKQAGQS